MVYDLNVISKKSAITRKEKLLNKKYKRRRIAFIFLTLFLISLVFICFKFINTKEKLSSSNTAVEHYLLSGFKPEFSRIDNLELIFSHTDKSIYKASGVDSNNKFNYLEICLKKNKNTWNVEYLKNLK
ncbi:MAG: hypothetical protein ACRDAU_16210 [Clostridium sp.]